MLGLTGILLVLLAVDSGQAIHATPGVPCWAAVCEFRMSLTMGHTMTRNIPGKDPEPLELQGGCLKPVGAAAADPCIPIPPDQASSNIVTADGRARNVLLINNQFPGPTIEVLENSEVVINVTNNMGIVDTAIHWHGITQKGSQWSDGAGFITQCPIAAGHSFVYRFKATPAGTTWYHPHLGNLRSDGHFGFIIVHKATPTIPEMQLMLSDWSERDGLGEPLLDFRAGIFDEIPEPVSALINGRGRFKDTQKDPLSWFQIEAGKKYRFRCNSAASLLAYGVWLDGHKLTIVSWDGADIQPIEVDSFNVYAGERVDFEITGKQNVRSSWIRIKALSIDPAAPLTISSKAILSYGPLGSEPTTQARQCTPTKRCKIFNCFRPLPSFDYSDCVSLKDIHTTEYAEVKKVLNENPSREIFMNVVGNIGDSINGIRFVNPLSPFYDPFPQGLLNCSERCNPTEICWCTHGITLEYNSLVDIVITQLESPRIPSHHEGHPMHIHGHRFALVAMGFGKYDPTTGLKTGDTKSIKCESDVCRTPTWNTQYPIGPLHLDNPPLKDNVILPPGGYVVLRMRADNPGYWLLHCHLLRDQIGGMELYLETAPEMVKLPAPQLPPCSPFFKPEMLRGPPRKDEGTPGDNGKNDNDDNDDDDRIAGLPPFIHSRYNLKLGELVAVVLGSVAAGIVLAVLIFLLSKCCCRKRKSRK